MLPTWAWRQLYIELNYYYTGVLINRDDDTGPTFPDMPQAGRTLIAATDRPKEDIRALTREQLERRYTFMLELVDNQNKIIKGNGSR